MEGAIALYQSGNLLDAFNQAKQLTSTHNEALNTDAIRLCALSSAALSNWNVFYPYWRQLFEQYEPTAHNAAQVASVLVKCQKVNEAEIWFQKALNLASDDKDFIVPQAIVNFVSALQQENYLKQTLPYLEQLKSAYEAYHVTDSHFLYMRGMPFFSVFLDNTYATIKAVMPYEQAKHWYSSMYEYMDDQGQSLLNELLNKHFPS